MNDDLRRYWAWQNAQSTEYGPDVRKTCDGWLIKWDEHGKCTLFGWHTDHIIPRSVGGLDVPSNVRARYWRDNVRAGAGIAAVQSGMSESEKRSPINTIVAILANQPAGREQVFGLLSNVLTTAQSPNHIPYGYGLLSGMRLPVESGGIFGRLGRNSGST